MKIMLFQGIDLRYIAITMALLLILNYAIRMDLQVQPNIYVNFICLPKKLVYFYREVGEPVCLFPKLIYYEELFSYNFCNDIAIL
jgi:hypothetical protein